LGKTGQGLAPVSTNPLEWWKVNGGNFVGLKNMDRDVFSCQGASLRSNDSPIIHLSLGSDKKKSGRGAWCVAGPSIWNELPISTRTEGVKVSTFLSLLYETLYSADFD
jgi:hypothetical protein